MKLFASCALATYSATHDNKKEQHCKNKILKAQLDKMVVMCAADKQTRKKFPILNKHFLSLVISHKFPFLMGKSNKIVHKNTNITQIIESPALDLPGFTTAKVVQTHITTLRSVELSAKNLT